MLAFLVSHVLYSIAQGGSGHLMGMLLEELTEQVHAASFAHLAKHPSHGFVHQVMRVVQMPFGIAQAP